jgi:hypothetical protein
MSQVELVWKPVQAWHRLLHLSPPIGEEATVCWLLVWRLDTMTADAGGSLLLTMVAILLSQKSRHANTLSIADNEV